MPKLQVQCKQCGQTVEFWPSQARQFCSQLCRGRWFAANGGHIPTKPRRGELLPCPSCQKPVYGSKGERESGRKRYCSRACLAAANRLGTSSTCEHCGEQIWVKPSTKNRFCSRACYEADRISRCGVGRDHNGRPVIKDGAGYLRIWEPSHPAANQGRVLEHRWLVEQELGRYLLTEEHVHHINGIKDDNRLENLAVLGAQEHRLLTAKELGEKRMAEAAELAEYRRRYGPLK